MVYRKQPFYLLPILLFFALRWQKQDKKLNPQNYRPHGVYVFTGLYGSGKSLGMVRYLNELIEKNPKITVYANFEYPGAIRLHRLSQIEQTYNPEGTVFCIDEAQLSFFCRDFGSFPMEMVSALAQNRKEAKMFLFATQNFTSVDSQIRLLTYNIVECNSWFGIYFRNRFYTPKAYEKRFVNFESRPRPLRTIRFVGYPELFEQYNTLTKLSRLDMRT